MLAKQKKLFSIVFFASQVFFLFFYISNQSKIVELTYDNQKLEKKKESLVHQFENLKQDFFKLKKYQDVKSFVTQNNNFEKIRIDQLKSYEHELCTQS